MENGKLMKVREYEEHNREKELPTYIPTNLPSSIKLWNADALSPAGLFMNRARGDRALPVVKPAWNEMRIMLALGLRVYTITFEYLPAYTVVVSSHGNAYSTAVKT
ncbi:hypothetical protein M0804_012237 [Polistes exclamans]|nr:hypothetical protein M0804_012237 [Polistes exclamans]